MLNEKFKLTLSYQITLLLAILLLTDYLKTREKTKQIIGVEITSFVKKKL